jgi:hypothetical protein
MIGLVARALVYRGEHLNSSHETHRSRLVDFNRVQPERHIHFHRALDGSGREDCHLTAPVSTRRLRLPDTDIRTNAVSLGKFDDFVCDVRC